MAAQEVLWSTLENGATYTDVELYDEVGNPDGVILHFDTPAYIDPYDVELLSEDLQVITVVDLISGKTVTFELDGLTVTRHNVTFEGGGLLLVGDDNWGTAGDNEGNHLTGGDDSDQLVGLGGDDLLEGGLGNDVFTDRYGANVLDGGGGDDFFYVYQDLGSSSTVTGGSGQDFYYLDYESPALLAPPGGPGNDYLVTDFAAGENGDIIYTSDLVYLVVGYVEDDPFAEGFLRFVYDDGTDTLHYQGDRDGAAGEDHSWMTLISLQGLTDEDVAQIRLHNLPDLLVGTSASESLQGTGRADLMTSQLGNDTITGLEGKDYLSGGGGNDYLDGGVDVDTMLGGAGSDRYRVNHKDDMVVELPPEPGALILPEDPGPGLAGPRGDTIEALVNIALANLVENLVLVGSASRGTGNSLANNMLGNAGADTLSGASGKDTLDGGSDGTSSDRLLGGAGDDWLIYRAKDRLDGGSNTDTLRTPTDLDLTKISNTDLKSIEKIDLTAAGRQKLTLNASDILDLSENGNTIKVSGTYRDTVDIAGAFTIGGTSGAYRIYRVGTGILQVETDVAVT